MCKIQDSVVWSRQTTSCCRERLDTVGSAVVQRRMVTDYTTRKRITLELVGRAGASRWGVEIGYEPVRGPAYARVGEMYNQLVRIIYDNL